MNFYVLAVAAAMLVALPGCIGNNSCCKKECKKEETCPQQHPEEVKRESGPFSGSKEVSFTDEDRK
jgi:hypothetical protein